MKLNLKPDPPHYTPTMLNLILFAIGMVIVWEATHNWVAVLGCFIASLHVSIRVEHKQ